MTERIWSTENVFPITLELDLDRTKNGETWIQTIQVQCHGYIYEVDGDITLFRVEAGALKIIAGYRSVLSYRELEAANG